MICMECAEFRGGGKGSHCPTCGAVLVSDKRANVERLFEARTRQLLSRWRQAGLVSVESVSLLAEDFDRVQAGRSEMDAEGPAVRKPAPPPKAVSPRPA